MNDELLDYEKAYDLQLSPTRKVTVMLPKGLGERYWTQKSASSSTKADAPKNAAPSNTGRTSR